VLGRLLALSVLSIQFSGCASLDISLPAVVDAPTGLSLPGKVVWHDLITHTPEESRRFYETLFGWEFENVGVKVGSFRSVNYALIRHEGRLIGGMVDANLLGRREPEKLSQWVVVMSVPDVDAAVAEVAAQGGAVRHAPVDLDSRGRLAMIEDAFGADLALLQTRGGDPADTPLTIGSFLWDEVWTDDLDGTTNFYAKLTGLEPDDKANAQGGSYRLLSSAETPRVGVLATPLPDLPSTWVSYVRVADADRITERVPALGGHVLIDVTQRDAGGEAALIADPSGAAIAIQTWTQRTAAADPATHFASDQFGN
jgi:predicted enzyme related to lactoylglutathione lyase